MVLPLDELFEGLDRQPLVPDDVFHLFHLRGVELRRVGSGLRAGNPRQTVQLLDVLSPEVHVLLGVALWWIVGRPRENQKDFNATDLTTHRSFVFLMGKMHGGDAHSPDRGGDQGWRRQYRG